MLVLWLTTGLLAGSQVAAEEPQLFPSGWYYAPRKPRSVKAEQSEEVTEAVEEAAQQVAAVVKTYDYKVSPKQVERIAAAAMLRIEAPKVDVAAVNKSLVAMETRIAELVSLNAARNQVERIAGQMVALLAMMAIARQREDEEDFLLLAAA